MAVSEGVHAQSLPRPAVIAISLVLVGLLVAAFTGSGLPVSPGEQPLAVFGAEDESETDGPPQVEVIETVRTDVNSATFPIEVSNASASDSFTVQVEFRSADNGTWRQKELTQYDGEQSFSATVDDLKPGTAYYARVLIQGSDFQDMSEMLDFETDNRQAVRPSFLLAHGPTTRTYESVTVEGQLAMTPPEQDTVDVALEYRERGALDWTVADTQQVQQPRRFEMAIANLTAQTTYEYRFVAEMDERRAMTATRDVTTPEQPQASVEAQAATDVTWHSAQLNGAVLNLGIKNTSSVWFDYRTTAASNWTTVEVGTVENATAVTTELDGLTGNTTYQYRVGMDAADGVTHSETREVTTDIRPSMTPVAEPAQNVTWQNATLTGRIDGLGLHDRIEGGFEYRQANAANDTNWTAVSAATVSNTTAMNASIADLEPNTTYEYRAVAIAPNESVESPIQTFQTDARPAIAVETNTVANLTTTKATLRATVDDLGVHDWVEVTFAYRSLGSESWTNISETVSEPQEIETTVSKLDAETEYEYRVTATREEDTDDGGTQEFTTPPEPSVAVTTQPPQNVTHFSARLSGEVTELVRYDEAIVGFEYRPEDKLEWTELNLDARADTGGFAETLTGLDTETQYEIRAIANVSDDRAVGDVVTIETRSEPALGIRAANQPSELTPTEATIDAELTNLTGLDEAAVYVEYRQNGSVEWQQSENLTRTSTGEFNQTLTGLESNTTYEYRVVTTGNFNTSDTSATYEFTTEKAYLVEMEARPATSITETDATLNSEMVTLQRYNETLVWFQYRPVGAEDWQPSRETYVTSETNVSISISGLNSGTEYEFRGLTNASQDGYADEVITETRNFTTKEPTVSVHTQSASNITSSSATLTGNLTELEVYSSADVSIEYREAGTTTWQQTTPVTRSSTGEFEFTVSGLSSSTEYEYRGLGVVSDDSDTGDIKSFTTGS